jgi:hypothetical protein
MVTVSIYLNPETEEYTVSAPGFDDFSTFDEVEARDEAESMAVELSATGHDIRREGW